MMGIVIKICKVCGKDYEAYDKARASTMRSKSPRRSNSLTCSPYCAKQIEYSRWYAEKKKELKDE